MKIIIDAMGGDNAPREIVKGALRARKELGVDLLLVGKQEEIETAYGVTGMAREVKRAYAEKFGPCSVVGTVLCILGVMPLFIAIVFTERESVYVIMTALLLLLVGLGAACFVMAGVNRGAVDMLLEEGDYVRRRKRWRKRAGGAISGGYWMMVTALYLVWSFLSEGWERTWIVWPVAGVLFPVVITVAQQIGEQREKTKEKR